MAQKTHLLWTRTKHDSRLNRAGALWRHQRFGGLTLNAFRTRRLWHGRLGGWLTFEGRCGRGWQWPGRAQLDTRLWRVAFAWPAAAEKPEQTHDQDDGKHARSMAFCFGER